MPLKGENSPPMEKQTYVTN